MAHSPPDVEPRSDQPGPPSPGGHSPLPGGPSHFGPRHRHKPLKTIVGIAIFLALSFVLYQFSGKKSSEHAAPGGVPSQTVPAPRQ